MELALKNFKEAKFQSEETMCFQATLYIDGARAAVVSNSGIGGPNEWHWLKKELEAPFIAHCRSIEEHAWTSEFDDAVISDLIEKLSHMKVAKSFAKDGLPVTVLVKIGPHVQSFPNSDIPDSTTYDESFYMGLLPTSDIDAFCKKNAHGEEYIYEIVS